MQVIDQIATVEDLKKRYCSNCNSYDGLRCRACNIYDVICDVEDTIPVAAVPVSEIESYLLARLDEWNALGDRKFEPENAWGYNFIRACFDDLEKWGEEHAVEGFATAKVNPPEAHYNPCTNCQEWDCPGKENCFDYQRYVLSGMGVVHYGK